MKWSDKREVVTSSGRLKQMTDFLFVFVSTFGFLHDEFCDITNVRFFDAENIARRFGLEKL